MTTDISQFRSVPQEASARRRIWYEALEIMREAPRRRPMTRLQFMQAAQCLLDSLGMEERFLGYAMVMLSNAFWLDQFLAKPVESRLLLLPRCLADLHSVRAVAGEMGYRIYVADGSPVVVRIIDEEQMEALIGVGCLESLEKAFEKVRQLGVPSIAIPLNTDGCKDTGVDVDFVLWFLRATGPSAANVTRNYFPRLRQANRLFDPQPLRELLAPFCDFGSETTRSAVDWLQVAGKRLRPFVTLAAYQALSEDGETPPAVRQVAVAIETFHKASLIHDDIEDQEEQRYERQTLHREFGIPVAINVGDYLLGLGYQLVAAAAEGCGDPQTAAVLLRLFSDAHVKLTLGQGAELSWSRAAGQGARPPLPLREVLQSYMLKTSPAFEAALSSGLALAGADRELQKTTGTFCKHLGAAYQVMNDLDGWQLDAAHRRPNALLALALERCREEERCRLFAGDALSAETVYMRHNVFERADLLIQRLRSHALATADEAKPDGVGDLLHALVEMIVR